MSVTQESGYVDPGPGHEFAADDAAVMHAHGTRDCAHLFWHVLNDDDDRDTIRDDLVRHFRPTLNTLGDAAPCGAGASVNGSPESPDPQNPA